MKRDQCLGRPEIWVKTAKDPQVIVFMLHEFICIYNMAFIGRVMSFVPGYFGRSRL